MELDRLSIGRLYQWLIYTADHLIAMLALPRRSSPLFQKEMLVAFFYAAGIWGPVIIITPHISLNEYLITAIFAKLFFFFQCQ
ncbi:MAG: hypothetical protein ABFS05_05160, partial [Bacteroidota bacterium]